MNLEFFVHGVPYGHCVWNGDKVSDSFINQFYVSYKGVREQARLVVDIARNGSAVSSYYTYLRTCSYSDSEGRSGSFFGMTLRFDGYYCREVAHVFNILDEAYNRAIVGQVIESHGGVSKYRISDFKQADTLLKGICEELFGRLEQSMFLPIDGSFAGRDAKRAEAFNPADTGCPAFFDSLRQSGKAYVSPEYPANSAVQSELRRMVSAERENVAREQKLAADRQQQIDELERDIERKNKTIEQLNGEKSRLQQQIDGNRFRTELASEQQRSQKLEEENRILRQQNEDLASREVQISDDVHRQIDALYDDMNKMRRFLREYRRPGTSKSNDALKHDHGNGASGRGMLRRPVVKWIVLLTVLAGMAYGVHSCNAAQNRKYKTEKPNNDGTPSTEKPADPKINKDTTYKYNEKKF
ncbi:MAG: hypothetical protein K2F95_05900 [Alistipes sp.]|nr:hypothetical protein [Alistipes sp.]